MRAAWTTRIFTNQFNCEDNMGCVLGRKNNVTFFQCSNIGLLDGLIEDYAREQAYRDTHPYEEGECTHDDRFDHQRVLTCKKCCATYDEKYQEWVK